MIPFRILTFVILLNTGTVLASEAERLTPIKISKKIEAAVVIGIKRSLKDPDSAKFSSMKAGISASSEMIVVCGLVNAKNSYGGYTGKLPFQAWYFPEQGKAMSAGMGGTDFDTSFTYERCAQHGLPIN